MEIPRECYHTSDPVRLLSGGCYDFDIFFSFFSLSNVLGYRIYVYNPVSSCKRGSSVLLVSFELESQFPSSGKYNSNTSVLEWAIEYLYHFHYSSVISQ